MGLSISKISQPMLSADRVPHISSTISQEIPLDGNGLIDFDQLKKIFV